MHACLNKCISMFHVYDPLKTARHCDTAVNRFVWTTTNILCYTAEFTVQTLLIAKYVRLKQKTLMLFIFLLSGINNCKLCFANSAIVETGTPHGTFQKLKSLFHESLFHARMKNYSSKQFSFDKGSCQLLKYQTSCVNVRVSIRCFVKYKKS